MNMMLSGKFEADRPLCIGKENKIVFELNGKALTVHFDILEFKKQ